MPGEKRIAGSTLRELANVFRDAMDDYADAIEAGRRMTRSEVDAFHDAYGELADATHSLRTQSVGVSVRNLTQSIQDLRELAHEAREAAREIADLEQALSRLAKIAAFATAIATGDVQGIGRTGLALAEELGVGFG